MKEKVTCDVLIKNTSYLDENYNVQDNVSIAVADGEILKIVKEKSQENFAEEVAKQMGK